MTQTRALVLTVEPYKYSTRAGKAARAYACDHDTHFLTLARAGRTQRWDEPGRFTADGVKVRQLSMIQPRLDPTRSNQVFNLLFCYLPAVVSLAVEALRIDAETVHVTGSHLGFVGWLHARIRKSRLVLDVTERPGMVDARGSLATAFSRFELRALRAVSSTTTVATVATPADAPVLRRLGFGEVMLLRNVPELAWRAEYYPPANNAGILKAAVIGSIFEGRGYEMLLRAVAMVDPAIRLSIEIVGPGRPQYLATLKSMAQDLKIGHRLIWTANLPRDAVSAQYLKVDLGLVLYEGTDQGNDGLSNKLMECVATGRPVIAGNLPQNRQFVQEEGVGWVSDMDVESLARTIEHAAWSTERESMAFRCRTLGDQRLNWEAEFAPITTAAIIN